LKEAGAMTDDEVVNLRVERRMRRLREPDGNCFYCEHAADRYAPVGPLTVRVTMHNDFEPGELETWTHEFCCWECLADWAAVQAGRGSYPGG
jgi:hypothetical protein